MDRYARLQSTRMQESSWISSVTKFLRKKKGGGGGGYDPPLVWVCVCACVCACVWGLLQVQYKSVLKKTMLLNSIHV